MTDRQGRFEVRSRVAPDDDEPRELLAGALRELREVPGCPTGSDEAILAMSSPPAHTACPNPFLRGWVEQHRTADEDRADPGPYAADTSAGKTSLVYKAHSYPTKVPHEVILRLLLHYTKPGDIVLDGFCGTGMTGVAAQMCGGPDPELRQRVQAELGDVQWGARRAVLQDLGPSATFIAAGLNLPVAADAFDSASADLLERFDAEYGWMYETTLEDGRTARIDYTVWSEVMTCPHCAGRVVFYDSAFDEASGRVREEFPCPTCGATLTKSLLERRFTTIRTLASDQIERIELVPVRVHWRHGKDQGEKLFDVSDRAVLDRVAQLAVTGFPSGRLPIDEMTHGSRLAPKGFGSVHHLWSDRALVTLATLWNWASETSDREVRRALKFWVEQGFWGFSWMNRYSATHFSQVNRQLTGVYYVGSLHAEPSLRYGLEGSRPSTGKRASLGKLWGSLRSDPEFVRISTGSSTQLDIPTDSIDYIFVDPPFGANIPYADLALVVESWHGVETATAEEAIQHDKQHKDLPEYYALMLSCFEEFHRVLKPGRWMTVEFSNSSNAVWAAIQQALAASGFVVADTRVLDKEQHSFRQVTATNAVKRDLIISAYKPRGEVAEKVKLEGGSEDAVWAFVREHLQHLPVRDLVGGVPRVVRERQADRLYDRMVAFHVAQGIVVPMTVAEFYSGLDRRLPLRDSMYFLPGQAEEYERLRASGAELEPAELFITGENSAVQWLRQFVGGQALPYSDIQPAFFAEVQKGIAGWEELPDLRTLLDENFVTDDHGRYLVPDPKKAEHLEQLRTAELLNVFDEYAESTGPLEQFRAEALKAGFKRAYQDGEYSVIVSVGRRIPTEAFNDDTALMHYFRNAERLEHRNT